MEEENNVLSLVEVIDCIKDNRSSKDSEDDLCTSSQFNNNEDFETLIKWFKD